MSLLDPWKGPLLGLSVLLLSFAAGAVEPSSDGLSVRARSESFVLFERGRVWSAERVRLGTARATSTTLGLEAEVELSLELEPIATRVQRVLRRRGAETTLIWREWRTGKGDGGASSGRTLVVEVGPRGSFLREWAGGAMRAEASEVGTTTLELVASARRTDGFAAAIVRRFDPLEAVSRPALVLQTPLAWGLPGSPRVLNVIDLVEGSRPSSWYLAGSELVAFAEGGWIGSRCPDPADEAQVARAADL